MPLQASPGILQKVQVGVRKAQGHGVAGFAAQPQDYPDSEQQ